MSSQQAGHSSSFTDLMASLLAVFVLLFVAAQNKKHGERNADRDLLIRALRGELTQAGIDSASVSADPRDPNAVVVVLPEKLFFRRGEATMLDSGKATVRRATPGLVRILCGGQLRQRLDQVVVEGHTDITIPPGMSAQDGKRYNLRLSQLRSMDFVATSTEALSDSSQLSCYLALVSATGRGQEDRIKNLPPDHDKQRRVQLKIRMREEIKDTTTADNPILR